MLQVVAGRMGLLITILLCLVNIFNVINNNSPSVKVIICCEAGFRSTLILLKAPFQGMFKLNMLNGPLTDSLRLRSAHMAWSRVQILPDDMKSKKSVEIQLQFFL